VRKADFWWLEEKPGKGEFEGEKGHLALKKSLEHRSRKIRCVQKTKKEYKESLGLIINMVH
jgi:hypothetical protein